MSNEGYMTEEEFKQAIERAVMEICGCVYGPICYERLSGRLFTAPPQQYRGVKLKTYNDIYDNIGHIYYQSVADGWAPGMGTRWQKYSGCWASDKCFNFPQSLKHVTGDMLFETMKDITVRKLGCRVFAMQGNGDMPKWLNGLLVFQRPKYDKIMDTLSRFRPQKDNGEIFKWTEPSAIAARLLGPTDEAFIELWRLTTKKRLDAYNAECEKIKQGALEQLNALSVEIIEFLEKIPFRPKYGELTNCADVPIATTPE